MTTLRHIEVHVTIAVYATDCHYIMIKGLVTEVTFWGDVIVTPLKAAYTEKALEPMYEDDPKSKANTDKADGMDTHS